MKFIFLVLSVFAFGLFNHQKPTCEKIILESFQPSSYCCYDEHKASFAKRPEDYIVVNFVLDIYDCKFSEKSGKLNLSGMFWYETKFGNIRTTDIKPVQNVTIFKGVERNENLFITDTIQTVSTKGEFCFKTKLTSNENVYIQAPHFGLYFLKLQ